MTASQRVRLLLDSPLPETRDELLRALQHRRLVGYVDAPGSGDVAATLHLLDDHLLVVSTSGVSLTYGPSCQDLVEQLAAHLGVAAVVVDAEGSPWPWRSRAVSPPGRASPRAAT